MHENKTIENEKMMIDANKKYGDKIWNNVTRVTVIKSK